MTLRDSPQTQADAIFERIRSIVANRLGMDPRQVTPATSVIHDLEVDSLEQIELIMELEDVFDVMISDCVAEAIVTIQDAVDYIERQRRRKSMFWPGPWSVSA